MSVICASVYVPYNSLPTTAWRGRKRFASLLVISLALHMAMLVAISNNRESVVDNQLKPVQQRTVSITLEPVSSITTQSHSSPHEADQHIKPITPHPIIEKQAQNNQTEALPTAESKNTEAQESLPPAQNENSAPLPSSPTNSVDGEEAEQHYLAIVRALINAHKFYPESARRRGLQGKVLITFQVNPDGSISNIDCAGGPLLLQTAAEEALREAGPFPVDQFPGVEPLKVHYEMAYQLN